ncbi:MAG: D-tyrosyl-tRNA(Tyr) deacylase [Gemmatimonadales bacterium]|nr:MAG: D-tyrosyl-tRNA(Tyr) deacylase [Gemmatimonadales bacterium]
MRVVIQRVSKAGVTVEGRTTGAIGPGLLVLAGFADADDEAVLGWMADKLVGLRVFNDGEGRMNLSLAETGGDLLLVSQFTLYGDARKGRRPSFGGAAGPERAEELYEAFLEMLEARAPGALASGEFGAMMEVSLVNDGPVTLFLEREAE